MECYSVIGYYEKDLEYEAETLLPLEKPVLLSMLQHGKDKERRHYTRMDGLLPVVAKLLIIDPSIKTRNFYVMECQDRSDLRVSVPGGHVELFEDVPFEGLNTVDDAMITIYNTMIRESLEESRKMYYTEEFNQPNTDTVEAAKARFIEAFNYVYNPISWHCGEKVLMKDDWLYYFSNHSITIFVPIIAKLKSEIMANFTRSEFLCAQTWCMRNPGKNQDRNDIRYDSRYQDYVAAIMNTMYLKTF